MPTLSITRSVEIDAPVEQVFAFIADPCRRMSAMSRVYRRRIAVSDVVASPDGVVKSYTITTRFFWLPFSTTIAGNRTVHVANERVVDKALVWTKDVDDFALEPSGNGTRLTWRYEVTTPRALIKVWEGLTAKGKGMERLIEGPLAQFKRELETAPRGGAPQQAADEAVSDKRVRTLVRRFDKALQQRLLLERYDEKTAATVRHEIREELRRVIPQLPDIGGRENPEAFLLDWTAWALAVYRVVLRHGGNVEDAGRLLHECYRAYVQRIPHLLRPALRWYIFSGLRRRQLKKAAQRSQARRYPGDFVFEVIDGDGTTFDYGRDFTECGAVTFMRVQGADELTPYLCEWDYILAETLGFGLRRTKTLAWGCDRCDFRNTRGGTTSAPWPPRFIERTCGQPQTSTPEHVPTP